MSGRKVLEGNFSKFQEKELASKLDNLIGGDMKGSPLKKSFHMIKRRFQPKETRSKSNGFRESCTWVCTIRRRIGRGQKSRHFTGGPQETTRGKKTLSHDRKKFSFLKLFTRHQL